MQVETTVGFPWQTNAKQGYSTNSSGALGNIISKLQFPNDLMSAERPNYTVIFINELKGTRFSLRNAGKFSTDNPVSAEKQSGAASMQSSVFIENSFQRLQTIIALPMPSILNSSYNMSWLGTDSIGPFTELSNKVDEKAVLTQRVGANINRVVTNKTAEAAFTAVSLRQPQLVWDLYPKNITEVKAIWDIVQVLKYFSLPEKTRAGFTTKSSAEEVASALHLPRLYSPAIFDFEFHHGTEINNWLPKSLSCGIQNISIEYISTGTFQGFDLSSSDYKQITDIIKGSPSIGISLNIQFQEIEVLTRDRIDPKGDMTFTLTGTPDQHSQGLY